MSGGEGKREADLKLLMKVLKRDSKP